MPFTIRRIDPQRNFVDPITWDILATTIPVAARLLIQRVPAAVAAHATHCIGDED